MQYKGIIFDMGDIFFDATPWRRALAKNLASMGVDIDYPRLVPLWEKALVPVYTGKAAYWDVFRGFMKTLGLSKTQAASAEEAAKEQSMKAEKRTLFPQVLETLKRLHSLTVKLAILSDTESTETRVRERLADLGIGQYFHSVVTSFDIGHVKPESEAFLHTLKLLEVPKDHALFVAHDLDELQGAKEFGLCTVAYNYEQGVPATYYLKDFSELVSIVLKN